MTGKPVKARIDLACAKRYNECAFLPRQNIAQRYYYQSALRSFLAGTRTRP